MIIAQIETAVEAGSKAMEGRSDGIMFVVAALVLVGAFLWISSRAQKEQRELDAVRDKAEAERYERQHSDHIRYAERNAEALDAISRGMEKSSQAAEIMASTSRKTEATLEAMLTRDKRVLRTMGCVIEAADSINRQDGQRAGEALREARASLLDAGEDR